MKELLKLLNIFCGPTSHGKEFVNISCYVDFEPFGRASETWEIVWKLKLTQIPHHWKSTKGWRKGKTDKAIRFIGKTQDEVVAKAVMFLKESSK